MGISEAMNGISVIITTHQKGETLRNCLTKVIEQITQEDEIIIIDDGGEDREVVPQHEQIRYFWIPHQGYRLALIHNIGIRLSTKERIVKIDADCIPQDGWLDIYRESIIPWTLTAGTIDFQGEDRKLKADERSHEIYDQWAPWYSFFSGNFGLMRADAFRIGLFDEDYNFHYGAEDADFAMRATHAGMEIRHVEAKVVHLWHNTRACSGDPERNRALLKMKEKRPFSLPVREDKLRIATSHLPLREPSTIRKMLDSIPESLSIPYEHFIAVQGKYHNELQELDEATNILYMNENEGPARSMNTILSLPGGYDFFSQVDDDIILPPGGLDQLYVLMLSEPEYDILVLYSNNLQGGALEEIIDANAHILRERNFLGSCEVRDGILPVEWTGFGCSMFRPQVFDKARFDPFFLIGGEDLDFSIQCKRAANKIGVVKDSMKQAVNLGHDPKSRYHHIRMNPERFKQAYNYIELKHGIKILGRRW
jgi:glycosyltransferase involved in cell wall biosynthesis